MYLLIILSIKESLLNKIIYSPSGCLFLIFYDKEKHTILTFEKLEPAKD